MCVSNPSVGFGSAFATSAMDPAAATHMCWAVDADPCRCKAADRHFSLTSSLEGIFECPELVACFKF